VDVISKARLIEFASAQDDFNMTVIKAFIEVTKLLPNESRGPVVETLKVLVEEHKEVNRLYSDLRKAILDETSDAE
jgi:hypothetical protein